MNDSTIGPVDVDELEHTILYFYPKDDTPGCTTQACHLRDEYARIREAGWNVMGVSKDPLVSHERFIKKHSLPFPLISDPDAVLAKRFGAYGEKVFMGRRFMGFMRNTYAIHKGEVLKEWTKVSPGKHAGEVLEWIGSQ